MKLSEKLNIASESKAEELKTIECEIVNYFKNIFESGKFESELERRVGQSEKYIRDRSMPIWVTFWDYHDGCSGTYFQVGYHQWTNPENPNGFSSRTYKGTELWDIQNQVGERLLNLTEYHLKEMGFRISVKDDSSWLKYYNKKITLYW